MTDTFPIAAASNGRALWYLTRSSGLVALILLSATVVLGVLSSVGPATARWPRFFSQAIHRNLSLLCLGFIGMHVVTTVADGYVPIGLLDAVVPFRSPYRPVYIGFGALTLDLLLAVLVTSIFRSTIGYSSWRFVHWLAYVCWPIALLHALGSGTDTRLPFTLAIDSICTLAVIAAASWRLWTGRTQPSGLRVWLAASMTVVTVAVGIFAVLGPLRPGWSRRAGPSVGTPVDLASDDVTTASATLERGGLVAESEPPGPFVASVDVGVDLAPSGVSGPVHDSTRSVRRLRS